MVNKKWTILIYFFGEVNEGRKTDLTKMVRVGSNQYINIVAEFEWEKNFGNRRFFIEENGDYSVPELQETNTGSPGRGDSRLLSKFLKWGANSYPAEHYMVILKGNRSGWKEDDIYKLALRMSPEKNNLSSFEIEKINRDDKSGIKSALFNSTIEEIVKLPERLRWIAYGNDDGSKDFLDSIELKKGLIEAAKLLLSKQFDILGFDGCLMNTLEITFQLKDTAKIIVGSEETEPNAGWPYDKLLAAISANPDMAPSDFGKIIVDSYIESHDKGADSEAVTLTAMNTKKMTDVLSAFNKMALALTKNVTNHDTFNKLLKITYDVQKFYNPRYMDLSDFARLLNERIDVKEIKESSKGIIDVLKSGDANFIIASENLTYSMSNAHGVSIYMPVRETYLKYYNNLDFANKSKWNEFINAYYIEYAKNNE
jgi:hypothetical protein